MATTVSSVFGVERSLSGKAWRWRGGNMDLGDGSGSLDDLVTQLLLSRGVERHDLERHRTPTLRAFQGDPRQGAEKPLARPLSERQRGNPSNLIRFTPA